MDSKKEIDAILSENTIDNPEPLRPMLEDHLFASKEQADQFLSQDPNEPMPALMREEAPGNPPDSSPQPNFLQEYLSKGASRPLEYLVRGATLECRMGSVPRKLNLLMDHGVYIVNKPVVHQLNCDPGEMMNIPPFGVCKVTQKPCMPIIVGFRWWDTYPKTRIVDNGQKNPVDRALASNKSPDAPAPKGEDSLTTLSFLICSMGGLIEPKDSGQAKTDAPRATPPCKKMHEAGGAGSVHGSVEDEEAFLKKMLLDMGWKEQYLTDKVIRDLRKTIHRFDITTEARLAHFLSQVSVESGYGRYTKELSGREGDAYFIRRYSNRLGNKTEEDAVRYSGGGYLQVTGKDNYQEFSDYMEEHGEGDPNIMEEGRDCVGEDYPWTASGHWWENNKMNQKIDDGASVETVSRRVNGGNNGMDDRKEAHKKATDALEKNRSEEGCAAVLSSAEKKAEKKPPETGAGGGDGKTSGK